ncbi:MAG: hypothetical protein ACI4SH_00300, partial [Candidatus Scatosoma sp.]
ENKRMKNRGKAIGGIAALAVTAALGGLYSLKQSAKTEERGVNAEEATTGFRMKEGASVRLNVEEGMYGIRFGAEVEDRERTYAMMIVPKELMSGYEEENAGGEKLTEYCERRAAEAGGSVAKAEELTADGQGEIACALVEIKWENLNRTFVGLAYYEENGERIEAARAEDGERSVREVAEKAIASGELTEEEEEAAKRLQEDGEKEARGIAVDAALGEELFGLSETENADGEWLSQGTKRLQKGEEEVSAEGWKLYGKSTIDTPINGQVWKKRLKYEGGTASFVMWSGQAAKAEFMTADGTKAKEIAFLADEWKEIRMPTEELTEYARLRIQTDEETINGIFMGEVTEQTAEGAAREVSEAIAALPGEDELQKADEAAFEGYRKRIEEANRLYGGLSERGKTLVEGTEKLERLTAATEERQALLYAWTNAEALITAGPHPSRGANVTVHKLTDGEYGNGWQITRSYDGTIYNKTEVALHTEKYAAATEGYGAIVFYVYAEQRIEDGESMEVAVSEEQYRSAPQEGKMQRKESLQNGAWVKITLTREEFLLCTRLTVMFDVGERKEENGENIRAAGTLKISAFYGVK